MNEEVRNVRIQKETQKEIWKEIKGFSDRLMVRSPPNRLFAPRISIKCFGNIIIWKLWIKISRRTDEVELVDTMASSRLIIRLLLGEVAFSCLKTRPALASSGLATIQWIYYAKKKRIIFWLCFQNIVWGSSVLKNSRKSCVSKQCLLTVSIKHTVYKTTIQHLSNTLNCGLNSEN